MEIGHQLRALPRIQKGFNARRVVERTDCQKGYISQLENDLSSPSMDTFFDILEVLGCHAADFQWGPEERSRSTAKDMTMMEDAKHKADRGSIGLERAWDGTHNSRGAVGERTRRSDRHLQETFEPVWVSIQVQSVKNRELEVVSKEILLFWKAKRKLTAR